MIHDFMCGTMTGCYILKRRKEQTIGKIGKVIYEQSRLMKTLENNQKILHTVTSPH